MRYMGSKRRIAKEILPIILRDRKEGQWYVEPFVGGANTLIHVQGNRMAADIDGHLIAMYKAGQKGWIPPEHITREEYFKSKCDLTRTDRHYIGYISHFLAFGGNWGHGFGQSKNKDSTAEVYRSFIKQKPFWKDVKFINCSYDEIRLPKNSIIYCDPPYQGTSKYRYSIDHNKFWQWCKEKIQEGHKVFVSEFTAPSDFVCVWQKETINPNLKNKKAPTVEKLFTM